MSKRYYESISPKENGILLFNERILNTAEEFENDKSLESLKNRLFFTDIFNSNLEEFFSVRDKNFANNTLTNRYKLLTEKRDIIIDNIIKDIRKFYNFPKVHNRFYSEKIFSEIREQFNVLNFDRLPEDDNSILYYPNIPQVIVFDWKQNKRLLIQPKQDIEIGIYQDGEYYYRFEDIILPFIISEYKLNRNSLWMVLFRTTFIELNDNFNTKNIDAIGEMYNFIIEGKINKKLSKVECLTKYGDINLFPDNVDKTALIINTGYCYIKDLLEFIKGKVPKSKPDNISNNYWYSNDKRILPESKEKLSSILLQNIREHDVIIEYPECSFDIYLEFIKNTINDPNVKAIYINIYRIGSSDKLAKILDEGVKKGKEINIHCEIDARFDELPNISWALYFTKIGVNVYLYKPKEIKIHSKCTLIEYYDNTFISAIGTGNLNETTSKLYTDSTIFTADQTIGESIYHYFQMIIDKTHPKKFDKSLLKDFYVSKINLKEEVCILIREEAEKGIHGRIFMKCNAMDDPDIISSLKVAANAGCRIDLLVRGFCDWKPSPVHLNDTVTIRSIIWKYLEHSRIYQFGDTILMGSSDMVYSKLSTRLESLVKVKDESIKRFLIQYRDKYLTQMDAHTNYLMYKDGKYLYKKKRV